MSASPLGESTSEFDSDEKQLLVHQSAGTTVINIDHGNGMASFNHRHYALANLNTSNSGEDVRVQSNIKFNNPNSPTRSGSLSASASGSQDDLLWTDKFNDLLRRSQDLDLVENCMYVAGHDIKGRPIIVFIGKWFRAGDFDTNKAVMYIVKLLHHVVTSGQDYVAIYFHAKTGKDNIPSYSWIKEVYTTLTYEYKKRLKAFYIVHPTIWTKMTCWWLATFMAPAIKKKIHNIHSLRELTVDGEQGLDGGIVDSEPDLSIPMFITEHDMSLNGLRYYKP